MCLIIEKPTGVMLENNFLNDVLDCNPHGWGIMWHSKGKLIVKKGMDRAGLFSQLKQLKNREVMIHARYTTHGETNIEMAHPFHVIDDIYLIHNGVLRGADYQCPENKVSDTYLFAKQMREVLSMAIPSHRAEYLRSPAFHAIVERETKGSSIVFADSGGFVIVGDALDCVTTDGLRVSNHYAFTVNNPSEQRSYKYDYDTAYTDTYGWGNCEQKTVWWEVDRAIKSVANASYEEILALVKSDPALATEMIMELESNYKPDYLLNSKAA